MPVTRPLRDEEIEIVTRIARMLEPDMRKQLLSDLNGARAENAHPDGSIVRFEIEGYVRAPFEGQDLYPIEMKVLDADGATLDVILFADQNGRLYELEYVRYHDGPIIGPDWTTLKLSVTPSN